MKRPAFQYYPADWRGDTALQLCTLAARGLWLEMMNLMHDGTPYGHLRIEGRDVSVPELARLVGESPAKVAALLAELEAHNIFSRTDTGSIYSRRMVRDEMLRDKRGAFGGLSLKNPNVPKPKGAATGRPKDAAKGADKDPMVDTTKDTIPGSFGGSPSSSSSSSSSELQEQLPSAASRRTAKPKPEPKYPHYPTGLCQSLHAKWGAAMEQAIEYTIFRRDTAKAFASPGAAEADEALILDTVELYRCEWEHASDRDKPFFTPAKWATNYPRLLRIAALPMSVDGLPTEKAAIVFGGRAA